MTPRPIHRWKSFWLGILVLGFLGWAWWISYGYWSYANYGRMVVAQGEGYVRLARGWDTVANEHGHQRVMRNNYVFEFAPPPLFARGEGKSVASPFDGPVRFKTALEWAYQNAPKDCWGVFLPHWLLVVLFLVPWLAFLFWRVRKQRNLPA